eukprot:6161187-Amphidinium_carterae.1
MLCAMLVDAKEFMQFAFERHFVVAGVLSWSSCCQTLYWSLADPVALPRNLSRISLRGQVWFSKVF